MIFKTTVARHRDVIEVEEFSSPVLAHVSELVKGRRAFSVLDFGKANSETIQYFSGFDARVCVVDAFDFLVRLSPKDGEKEEVFFRRLQRLTKDYLRLPEGFRFDLVLCWDGLNYLEPAVLRFLSRFLSLYSDSQTLLHAYFYTRREIPEHGGDFSVVGHDTVCVRYPGADRITGHCYAQTELAKLMEEYKVHKSMLLKNGIQEYLFSSY